MKRVIVFVAFMLLNNWVSGQTPSIQWMFCYGGTSTDYIESVQQTTDGGYILCGSVQSDNGDVSGNHGSFDVWLVKLSAIGVIQWQKCLGGSVEDRAECVKQTSDGGYIITGKSLSSNGDLTGNNGYTDFWILKVSSTGILQWQKNYGGSSFDEATSVQQTTDGGYIVAGSACSNNGDVTGHHGSNLNSDFWVLKLSSTGSLEWQKSLGGDSIDVANSVYQASDGGYIVAGVTYSSNGDVAGNHGLTDAWVVKLGATGNIQWQKCLGGTKEEAANSVSQAVDGGYILTCQTNSVDNDVSGNHSGSSDAWVVKLSSSGSIIWQKCYGSTAIDYGRSINITSDGGYILGAWSTAIGGDVTESFGGYDYWVLKLSPTGSIEWQKALGGMLSDVLAEVRQTSDGGYIVAGRSNSTAGMVTGGHGNYEGWVVKLSSSSAVTEQHTMKITMSPNPVTDYLHITGADGFTVQIVNSVGQVCKTVMGKAVVEVSDLPPGIFIINILDEHNIVYRGRIVKY